MLSRELGFGASWKMLTQERGWLKPLCVLALVGWIPILGQIAVLGYALEWARFTAWGIDTAPRQRGIDIGRILATGGRAFLVLLLMGIVARVVLAVLGFGDMAVLGSFLVMGLGTALDSIVEGVSMFSAWGVLMGAVLLLLGTFLTAAMMRATLYDSFGAGWRVDRLFQMIGRDPIGFLKTWLVSFIGGVICAVYAGVMALVGGVAALGGIAAIVSGGHGVHLGYSEYGLQRLLAWGAGPFMLLVLIVIAAVFVYGVISIAMQLVAVNAMGQWFCRFEVGRWGLSGDPLPDGVPVRPESDGAWSPNGGAPTRPAGDAAASGSAATGAADAASYWDNDDPVVPASPHEPASPVVPASASVPERPAAPAAPAVPQADASEGAAGPAAPDGHADVPAADATAPAAPIPGSDSAAVTTPIDPAPDAGAPVRDAEEGDTGDGAPCGDDGKPRGPIPLGPISEE